MNSVISSQNIAPEIKKTVIPIIQEIAGILSLFACAALPVFLIALTWL